MEESFFVGDFEWFKVFMPEFYSIGDDYSFGVFVNNLEAAVVGVGWTNVESVMSLVGPGMSCVAFVVDDDGATDGAEGCCIEVEGDIGVFPSGHGGVDGELAEKVESEFSFWEDLVPKVVGECGA